MGITKNENKTRRYFSTIIIIDICYSLVFDCVLNLYFGWPHSPCTRRHLLITYHCYVELTIRSCTLHLKIRTF